MNKSGYIQQGWLAFQPTLASEILPLYHAHEQTFDSMGLHGRRHITRSLIFAEAMARFYYHLGKTCIDFEGLRVAVAFHDAGREGNGPDYWEKDSARLCEDYLLKQGKSAYYAAATSSMILQKKSTITSYTSQVVYDADVLEIMRLFVNTKAGYKKFRDSELLFLKDLPNTSDFATLRLRKQLMNEAWAFVLETERMRKPLDNHQFLPVYFDKIINHQHRYPRLHQFLSMI